MNKYQEALNTLTDWFHSYKNEKGITVHERHITPKYEDAKKTIQELVDKETPKKPKRKRLYYNCHNGECDKAFIYYCPVCNYSSVEDMNYCPECSQKLKGSDEDE